MMFFWRRRQPDISLNDPLLTDEDGSSETYRQPGDLDDLVAKFGRRLLNASPRDISKLKAAVENDETDEISEIIGAPDASTNPTNNETEFSSIDISQDSLFKMAVDECKTEWVKFFLEKIRDKSIPFEVGAAMMKENFNNLWLDYKFLVEDLIQNDVLGWDICKIEVPLETFTVESNLGSRVGTCNSITEWLEASEAGAGPDHWRSLNSKGVDNVLQKSRERKVNATVRIYCFEKACQIGLDGISRFLLMNKAPSSLFKSPLIKWTILFKWERIWKRRSLIDFALFLVVFIAFHCLVLFFTSRDYYVSGLTPREVCFFVVETVILGSILIVSLRREYLQLKRYICDFHKVFGSGYFRGIGFYLSSTENLIDLVLSCVMIYFFFILVSILIGGAKELIQVPFLVSCLAFEVLFMWAKGFYYAQAFKRSGIFAVMIGKVLQECAPYFFMLIGLVVGFGLAMHAVCTEYEWKDYYYYRYYYYYYAERHDKSKTDAIETFGTLDKSILTMVSAMAGLFDPKMLVNNGSGKWLMILIFIIYLFLQIIVMFNMLIACIGDAFDGVRAEEEELFLMARAMFIDQYEASLSKKEIHKLQSKIGKYLYVLIPEEKRLENIVAFWKGRIRTIKEDATKIVMDSQNEINRSVNEMAQTTYRMFTTLEGDIAGLKEKIVALKQRIGDQESNQ